MAKIVSALVWLSIMGISFAVWQHNLAAGIFLIAVVQVIAVLRGR